MAGYLSAVNLTAAAGILGNVGGVSIAANAAAISNLNNYNNLDVIVQFANVKSTGNSILSSTVATSLNNLAGNIFPAVTNAVPAEYISTLGNTSVAGFTDVVSTSINNIMGNGDLGKFEQTFTLADVYRFTTNQLINSAVNANNASSNATYTAQDNTITGGVSQISQAYRPFGEDLVALGYSVDFSFLSDIGSPQALLRQIYSQSGGSIVINTALLNAGISQDTLYNLSDVAMTDEEQKIVFDVMSTVTGQQLAQILQVLKVTTSGLTTLADLLNPVKMFPNSFNTLTAPTVNGIRGIYINSSGAVNSALSTTLPSNVLAPLQGYQTVQNTYSQLKKIIPPDWALANKALQAGFEQIKSIFNTTMPVLGAAITELESNKDLNLINAFTSPIPTNVNTYFTGTYGSGTGQYGTLLLADIIGTAGGWVVNDSVSAVVNTLTTLTNNGNLNTLTDSTNGVFTVMQNTLDGDYTIEEPGVDPDPTTYYVEIPTGLPAAGTYDSALTADDAITNAFDGVANVVSAIGLIPAAYSLIGNIVANNVANVSIANTAWSNIASQLVLQNTLQPRADIVYANLIPGTSPTSLATNIGQYGLDTAVGGAAWLFESLAVTSTQGGQAIISSMREARNQALLNTAGVISDIIVDDVIPEPQISITSGQYTVAEAVNQKII